VLPLWLDLTSIGNQILENCQYVSSNFNPVPYNGSHTVRLASIGPVPIRLQPLRRTYSIPPFCHLSATFSRVPLPYIRFSASHYRRNQARTFRRREDGRATCDREGHHQSRRAYTRKRACTQSPCCTEYPCQPYQRVSLDSGMDTSSWGCSGDWWFAAYCVPYLRSVILGPDHPDIIEPGERGSTNACWMVYESQWRYVGRKGIGAIASTSTGYRASL
jgi:hypothetical protein